jgi:hypothetical protein
MITVVSSAANTQPVAPATKTSAPKQAPAKAKSEGAGDSVHLSQAAQAAATALQEASETPAQTAQEAGNGDLQAQRLLAKETAAAK